MVPIDRLLVETDAPYLAPMPYRGKRNEPGYTRYVVEKSRNCVRCLLRKSPSKRVSMLRSCSTFMKDRWRIEEIIVVEGKDDTRRLQEVFDVDTIETIGSAIDETILSQIEHAQETRGVIVLRTLIFRVKNS